MKYLGDFALGSTVRCMFSTNAAAGSRVDFSNALEVADVRVYKNGSTTERSSTAGFTVTSGFDSMVGVHFVAIDTSDNTDAGFFVASADYTIVLYPDETVDSLSVAAVIGEFSIENRIPGLAAFPTLSVGPMPALAILDRGTAQSATGTTLVLRSAAVFADDTVIGATLAVYGSTQGYWQTRSVTDYVLSSDTATVDTWTVTPSGTITYVLYAGAPASATLIPAVNATQFAGQAITAAAGVTLPSSVASPTNITAGTITTATNVTTVNGLAANVITAAATAADFTTEIQSGLATAAALTTVSGKIDTVDDFLDTEIAAIKTKTDSLTFTVAAQLDVNVLAIDGDTTTSIAESTAVPSASAGFMEKFRWLFTLSRNKITQTATTQLLKADDGTTTVGTSTVSDDGTTATRGEWA